jgi:hypothetical protein
MSLMRVGTAIPTRLGKEADGAGRFDPALGGEDKTIEARLFSNPIEFDGIAFQFPSDVRFHPTTLSALRS